MNKAYFAGGCFWCIEAAYNRLKGVKAAISGYAGGHTQDPSYEQVSYGNTGHAETVEVTYDPKIIDYDTLLSVFFTIHDPTQYNRQGNDVGEQYRSEIFYADEDQKKKSEAFIKGLKNENIYDKPIVTKITKLDKFYKAEEYHQNYYDKNPASGYCQAIINPKLSKLREKYSHLLK